MESLTVIIPVYNREALIGRTLQSVADQSVKPSRLIVVDNDSSDGTYRAVERWMTSQPSDSDMEVTLLSERKPGASAARNRGLAEADTEWTMFFDSDDVMLQGHIERAISTAQSNPDADIIGWDVSQELPNGSRRIGRFSTHDMQWNNLVHAVMATQRYMARTSLFRRAGGWSEDAMVWNDWELGIRMLQLHPKAVKATGEPTVRMFFTPESITGTRRHADRCVRTLAIAEADLRRGGDERLLRWIDYRRAVLSAECLREGDKVAAAAILGEALSDRSPRRRFAVRLTHLHSLHIGRGAYITFRILSR